MTVAQLKIELARKFGFNPWPNQYEVDADTYGHVCQAVLDHALEKQFPDVKELLFVLGVAVGPHNGIMFQNVELILKKE